MKSGERGFTARKIAYCAVMTALLIAAQVALSFVSGVEIVTLLLACFSACAGLACGVATAICFSLLRCLLWGFYPNVIVLYLVYYPVFAAIFALLGRIDDSAYVKAGWGVFAGVNAMLLAICAASIVCDVLKLIKISVIYQPTVYALLKVIFAIGAALIVAFNAMFFCVRAGRLKPNVLKTFLFTATACICTICFTLLDDVITPAMLGFTQREALAYFYASFAAMLTQTVCTLVTLSLLSFPIMRVIQRILK